MMTIEAIDGPGKQKSDDVNMIRCFPLYIDDRPWIASMVSFDSISLRRAVVGSVVSSKTCDWVCSGGAKVGYPAKKASRWVKLDVRLEDQRKKPAVRK